MCVHGAGTAQDDHIFLDSDNLSNLQQIRESVTQSDAVVVLYTANFLSRPYCLVEMQTVVREEIPLIILPMKPSLHWADPTRIADICDNFPEWIRANNNEQANHPNWIQKWSDDYGIDVTSLGAEIKSKLIRSSRNLRGQLREPLNTQGSSSQINARMGGLACTLVPRISVAE